jgi:predicted metalloprotease with PDZ domain
MFKLNHAVAFLTILAVALAAPAAATAPPVAYTVHLDNPQTQVITIQMRLSGITTEQVSILMPTWRPGKYAILNPASEVRTLAATATDGSPLEVTKPDKTTWTITTEGNPELTVRYDLYANSLNDRTRHVDDTHAFLSGSSVFMLWPKHRDDPTNISFPNLPENWTIATGLESIDAQTLTAPNYDILADSPIEVGIHDLLRFQVDGKPHEIAIWGQADYNPEKLRRDFADIVREQAAIYGSLPYDRFIFLLHVQPGAGGGTEHYNSTIMQTRPSAFDTPDSYRRLLGLASHEMFHTWNVKRFRPAGLSPYDYTHENYTPSLWLAEGTTSYYSPLTLIRTDLITTEKYLEGLASSITGYRARPGKNIQSLAESSHDAWIKFNRAGPDRDNTTVSFYRKGSLASLVIDAEIRRQTNSRNSLDDVMRTLYQRFPYASPGYTPQDVIEIASAVADADLAPLFAAVITSTEPLPLEDALAWFGIAMIEEPIKTAWEKEEERDAELQRPYLGLKLSATKIRAVLEGGPAFTAGLNASDELIAINNSRVTASNFADLKMTLTPGETVTISYFRRDTLREITLTVAAKANTKLKLELVADPTPAQRQAFTDWLDQPWPESEDESKQDAQENESNQR